MMRLGVLTTRGEARASWVLLVVVATFLLLGATNTGTGTHRPQRRSSSLVLGASAAAAAAAAACTSTADNCTAGITFCNSTRLCTPCSLCADTESEVNGIPCAQACDPCSQLVFSRYAIVNESAPASANITALSLEGLLLGDEAVACLLAREDFPQETLAELYLANNNLTVPPANVSFLSSLTLLHMEDNNITSVDGTVWPERLVSLYLNRNDITSVDGQTWPNTIESLLLSDNELSSIANQTWPTACTTLYVFGNRLTDIDGQQWPAGIEDLALSTNAITSIEGQQWPESLRTLYIGGNTITSLEGQQWPESLVYLDAQANQITSIATQTWPPSLETLNLRSNRIASIDGQAWPSSIRVLRLDYNLITSIASQTWPASLQRLVLTGNQLTTIGTQQWPANLTEVYFYGNYLTTVAGQNWPQGLQVLSLAYNVITSIQGMDLPDSVEMVYLNNNRLTTISSQNWPGSLEILNVDQNYLQTIAGVGWPDSLKQLYVSQNFITSLFGVAWPASLEIMYAHYNRIGVLTTQQWPANLTEVSLFGNGIFILQAQQWPPALTSLYLGGSFFSSVSNQQWPASLTRLSLSFCRLTTISDQNWPAGLRFLELYQNQITTIDAHVWPAALITLNIGSNLITSIDNQDWPASLQHLLLLQNKITSIAGQDWPHGLLSLQVNENRLSSLGSQQWPSTLTILSLQRNMITSIEGQSWPPCLEYLSVYQNLLTTMDGQVWPSTLLRLDIGHNSISSIEGQVWPKSLTAVTLDNNAITSAANQQWPQGITLMLLHENAITSIDNTTWPAAAEAIYLHLNQLAAIDGQVWPDTINILSLHGNQLTSVAGQAWPAAIMQLSLSQNLLSSIAGQVWPTALSALSLDDNSLTTIDGQQWPETLRSLFVHNNLLGAIDAANLPSGLIEFTCDHNLLTAPPANAHSLTALETFDLSFNSITSVSSAYVWPPAISTLSLASNNLQDPAEFPFGGLPKTLTGFNINFNPWSEWFENGFEHRSGSSIFVEELSDLPCTVAELAMNHALMTWTCSASPVEDVSQLSSCSLGAGTPVDAPLFTWTCLLTDVGESLVQATDAYRSYSFDQANREYIGFYQIIFPLALGVVLVFSLALVAKRGFKKLDWFLLFLMFLSCFDLASDWGFYTIEITGSGFQDAYECVPSEPILGCNATDGVYSCEAGEYGRLHAPCGAGIALELPNAQNECECAGETCSEAVGLSGPTCAAELSDTGLTFRLESCDSYGGLDMYVNETCGFAAASRPNATGSNECECLGYSCSIVYQTSCKGWYGGNYTVLRYACLASCCIATLLFLIAWILKLFIVFRPHGSNVAPLSRGSVSDLKRQQRHSMQQEKVANALVGLSLLGLMLQDFPQLCFQLIYISVLDVTNNNLILAALVSTVMGVFFTVIFLANRSGEILKRHGGCFGRAFVFLFSLNGRIPRVAERYERAKKQSLARLSGHVNRSGRSTPSASKPSTPTSSQVHFFSHDEHQDNALATLPRKTAEGSDGTTADAETIEMTPFGEFARVDDEQPDKIGDDVEGDSSARSGYAREYLSVEGAPTVTMEPTLSDRRISSGSSEEETKVSTADKDCDRVGEQGAACGENEDGKEEGEEEDEEEGCIEDCVEGFIGIIAVAIVGFDVM